MSGRMDEISRQRASILQAFEIFVVNKPSFF